MSKEEKQKIEDLKLTIETQKELIDEKRCIILHQANEIIKLKNQKDTISYQNKEDLENHYISKDRIKDKIKKLEKRERQLQEESFILDNYLFNKETIKRIVNQKDILQELLEEGEEI